MYNLIAHSQRQTRIVDCETEYQLVAELSESPFRKKRDDHDHCADQTLSSAFAGHQLPVQSHVEVGLTREQQIVLTLRSVT